MERESHLQSGSFIPAISKVIVKANSTSDTGNTADGNSTGPCRGENKMEKGQCPYIGTQDKKTRLYSCTAPEKQCKEMIVMDFKEFYCSRIVDKK